MSINSECWTIQTLLKWTTAYFQTHQIDTPRLDAELLLAHLLDIQRIDLYLRFDQPLSSQELKDYKALIIRRINREPIAYIIGHREFWSKKIRVTPNVLIPRPETECLIESISPLLNDEQSLRVLEIGVGSGAIIIAMASDYPHHFYYGTDCSQEAISIASKNITNHVKSSTHVILNHGNYWEPFINPSPFDIIVSNPPYIPTSEIDLLQPEIKNYEPKVALDGGCDGLTIIRHIINHANNFLKSKGYLVLEIGADQKKAVTDIAISTGFYDSIICHPDYAGLDRVIICQKGLN